MTHHYLVTDTVPEFVDRERELPVVRDDRKVSGYIRQEQHSGLIGIYEKANPNAVWLDGTPWEAEHELFEAHFDRIMPWLEAAMERMPVLSTLGIKRTVHGAITHPPDGNPLVGPAPGLRNYWMCCGCQIGVGWGPGMTRELARWMIEGSADINMREFDPRRFGAYANFDFALTKAKEDYLLRHEIPFPGLNRTGGRPVKPSALYDRLKARGAIFEEVYGWERPRWFAKDGVPQQDVHSFRRAPWHDMVAKEVRAVRERVGVMDICAFSKVIVRGPDARRFVAHTIANRVPRIKGRIVLTHLLNERGRIEVEVTVARVEDDSFYFTAAAFFEQRLIDHFNRYRRANEDVTIENVSLSHGALAIQGPKARDVLGALTDAPLDNERFPWFRVQSIDMVGTSAYAFRLSYVGELGWELHMPMQDLADIYDAIWVAGEPDGIENYGAYAMNSMRMEKGFKGASELTNEVTLPEADVMPFVHMDGDDFVGMAATQDSLVATSRPWQCVYLAIDETDVDCHGAEAVLVNGKRIGAVSSGAFGHYVERSLAFAYVLPEYAKPGTMLDVMILGEPHAARVLGQPVYYSNNRRPRM